MKETKLTKEEQSLIEGIKLQIGESTVNLLLEIGYKNGYKNGLDKGVDMALEELKN